MEFPFLSILLRILCCFNHSKLLLTAYAVPQRLTSTGFSFLIIYACKQLQLFLSKTRVSDPNISKGPWTQHEEHKSIPTPQKISNHNVWYNQNSDTTCLPCEQPITRCRTYSKNNGSVTTSFASCLSILKFPQLTWFAAITPSKHHVDVFFMTATI